MEEVHAGWGEAYLLDFIAPFPLLDADRSIGVVRRMLLWVLWVPPILEEKLVAASLSHSPSTAER